jgi:hypothetical protein
MGGRQDGIAEVEPVAALKSGVSDERTTPSLDPRQQKKPTQQPSMFDSLLEFGAPRLRDVG